MFQSWTSLISRASSSSSSSSSGYTHTHSQPFPPSSPLLTHPHAHALPRPPVDIIITPATPYLAGPSGNGLYTPQSSAAASASRSSESEMRSRRRGSAGGEHGHGHGVGVGVGTVGRGARVLDFDQPPGVISREVGQANEAVVVLDDGDDNREEVGGHWGPAYEEVEMGSMGSDRGYGYIDVDTDAPAEGYQIVRGGSVDAGITGGTGNSWAYFPSSHTGYRRLVNPYPSSTSTPSSTASSPPTSRVKLNLLIFFFALVLASLGMISLMLPSLGGVEFGVRVVAHGHGRSHAMVGVEEGLDGLRLGHSQGQGQQIGHEVDGLKKRSQGESSPADVSVTTGTHEHDDHDDASPITPVVIDERAVNAHQASMKQSRERLERRLQKVGRRGLGGHVKRQKRRSWGIWAA